MKELVKNSRVCGYLEKIYRELNIDKFSGELEEPIITVQSTPRAYGHVTCDRVWKSKDSERYELNLGAGTLDRQIEEVVETVLHEMVHIYNLMHNIKDCSRGNTYHNKRFKEKAEEVGLLVGYDSKTGWSITSPSDDLVLYVADKGWSNILINRFDGYYVSINGNSGNDSAPANNTDTSVRKPSSTRKYICPCCGISTRATKTIRIMCMDCSAQMVVEN